jgi:hypothetical protein
MRHLFLTNENENHNLLNFYNLNTEFVISNTHQWDVKSIWKKRFFEVVKQLNKNIVSEIIVLIQKPFLLTTLVDQSCVRARLGRIKTFGF